MKRLVIAMTAAALLTVSCGGTEASGATAAPSRTAGTTGVGISIASFAFAPEAVTVPVGTSVTWTNDEASIEHTTTSGDAIWDSGTLQPGEQFSVTFDTPGTYTYFCAVHPSMTATIVVEG